MTTLTPILSEFWDDPQSWTLATYERHDGWKALDKALALTPKEVTDLAIWANDKNKVAALLEQARRVNPGSVQLRDFEAYLKTRQP